MKLFITLLIVLGYFSQVFANDRKISKTEYISIWSEEAVQQMVDFGIPASITMAQAILESGSGNSELARKGNNHFGIKCHSWKGKTMKVDDDKKNECFRVYKSAEESYKDHSLFLKNGQRYAFLFSYKKTDYKAWAKGLKKAGYATNPKYPNLLIRIIEENNLDELDRLSVISPIAESKIVTKDKKSKVKNVIVTNQKSNVKIHKVGVRYIVAQEGDTYFTIAKSHGLTMNQLYRFNDYAMNKDVLVEGDFVFLEAKKRMKLFKKEEIVVNHDMSIEELSQLYGVNVKTIKRLNDITQDGVVLQKGRRVILR